MAQARLSKEQIQERKTNISRLEAQIERWSALGADHQGLSLLREAIKAAVSSEEKTILARVKTLSFNTLADQLDLAKHQGSLEFAQAIYYDISEAPKKIDGARQRIAQLVEEIKRADAGELVEVGERI